MSDQENNALIAYFAVHPTQDKKGFMGGILVINRQGVPQEFRCTLPLRPTVAQRALYGNILEPYMFNELIGTPLVKALTAPPNCCLVERGMMLGLRERMEVPVIHLEKYGESLSPDGGQAQHRRLDSSLGGFLLITAITHHDYDTDFESVQKLLEQIFNDVDLLEPFERIATSFKALSERDPRFM